MKRNKKSDPVMMWKITPTDLKPIQVEVPRASTKSVWLLDEHGREVRFNRISPTLCFFDTEVDAWMHLRVMWRESVEKARESMNKDQYNNATAGYKKVCHASMGIV